MNAPARQSIRKSIVEKKVAIYDRALLEIPNSVQLHVGRLKQLERIAEYSLILHVLLLSKLNDVLNYV